MTYPPLHTTSTTERATAARHLIRTGQLDGHLALSFVIWPRFTDIPRWVLQQRKKAA